MSDARFERVKAILAEALDLPEAERGAFLDRACGGGGAGAGDAGLRAEVERILAASPERLRALRTGGFDSALREAVGGADSPAHAAVPERIGPYRIVGVLGEGGMGVVYLAEQDAPIRRQVALKLIKLGMDTREVIARFDGERQALALMDHPHVAKVFDAGVSEQGRPYFVMEYAAGIPITGFCEREGSATADRLRLFRDVCLAIHHAHQRGIIHRDVKPSNVLVSLQDGRATPKVIDFGVAKAINQRLTERTLLTETGVLVGTPEYMSPEQAESTGAAVDSTTDVYSLGILLYELLTGVLPRGPRDQDPPRPSARATSSGLRRQLRGDLDWIVMKAIERDRSRRYSSASEFAADVDRYLRNEPVVAGPPSTVYRMRKFARRHRVALAVLGVVVASLAGATIESNRQRLVAVRARDESDAVTRFLVEMLSAADPRNQGRAAPVGDVLDRAAQGIEGRLGRQPVVEGGLRTAMGSAYSMLGDYRAARAQLEPAVRILRRELGESNRKTLSATAALATLYQKEGRYREADSLMTGVLALQRRTLGKYDRETLQTMANLANLWSEMGRRNEAIALTQEALDGMLRVEGEENRETLETMHNLAVQSREVGRLGLAESLHVRVLGIQRRVLPPEHPELLASMNALGVVYLELKRPAEAARLFEETVAVRTRTLGPEHPETLTAMNNLASIESDRGRFAESAALHSKILETRRRVLGPEHPHTLMSIGNLGFALTQAGDATAGEPYLREAARVAERVLGPKHALSSVSLRKYGVCLGRLGRFDEAERALVRSRAILAETFGPDHERTRLAESDLADLRARRAAGP